MIIFTKSYGKTKYTNSYRKTKNMNGYEISRDIFWFITSNNRIYKYIYIYMIIYIYIYDLWLTFNSTLFVICRKGGNDRDTHIACGQKWYHRNGRENT